MLLKSIKLKNFRQFKEEFLEFSLGNDGKNVSIVLGDNGTGKTTFAQAFLWCLYGETNFSDKVLLNRHVMEKMREYDKASVRVELNLLHGEVEYFISREQEFGKDYSGKIKAYMASAEISKKGEDGNITLIPASKREGEIYNILPRELARYFFFDGERIENMSKEISTGKKSSEFAEAVNNLLGLNAMKAALGHLKPSSKYSVCGSYESEFGKRGNVEIEKLSEEIDKWQKEKEAKEKEKDELDSEITKAESAKQNYEEELKTYEDSRGLQEKKEELKNKIERTETVRNDYYKTVVKEFYGNNGINARAFFALPLIAKALKMLEGEDVLGKDIPYLHSKTIEFLLKQQKCICGTQLNEGSLACKELQELIKYLPPHSISNSIREFKSESRDCINTYQNLKELINEYMGNISLMDDEISDALDEIMSIDRQLNGEETANKIRSISSRIQLCEKSIRENKARRDSLLTNIGGLESSIKKNEERRQELALRDEKYRMIELFRASALRIYEDLDKEYSAKEKEVRERLEKTINELFKKIYNGDLVLSVDEKYHISVSVLNYSGEVETSTAQSISVIFAFITSIIKMAKENRKSENEGDAGLTSEPYPLVMDAPLSALDKRRIKTVCETLPDIAEQVIIFIKDTDGELAEKYIGDRIGQKYRFEKIDEFETRLV
ncbi:MAG: AAA family ATPase [Lachnospiraceae bacterium]|nr:AAA family ATPase [Lachnospiraceae bacterium]